LASRVFRGLDRRNNRHADTGRFKSEWFSISIFLKIVDVLSETSRAIPFGVREGEAVTGSNLESDDPIIRKAF
jgi:hypothetical protein